MTDDLSSGNTMDPPGGHSKEALEDAEKKMHVDQSPDDLVLDPTGDHDPQALQDAAKKFGTEAEA